MDAGGSEEFTAERSVTLAIKMVAGEKILVVDGQKRDSSGYSAAHWALPVDWMMPDFDDSIWPNATTYTNDTVGVDNKSAFTNFVDVFDTPSADAGFIWSSNLVLDNLDLLRTTID